MSRPTAPPLPFGLRTAAVALLSGGGLLLEVALTRLFSVLYYPPYVFAVLSLAVLGIGLGAAGAAWRAGWRRTALLPRYLTLAGGAFAGLLLFAVRMAGVWDAPLLGLIALPYVFIGLAISTLFSTASQRSPRLYLADLAGAAAGALAAVPLLNAWGPVGGGVVVAGLLLLAGAGLALRRRARVTGAVASALFVTLLALAAGEAFRVDMGRLPAQKPVSQSLAAGGELITTRWDAFARTDLIRPGDGGPWRLYIDGAAGSIMPPQTDNRFLLQDIGFFAFAMAKPKDVFILGPGAGLDVWFALRSEAERITAVEVNPASVTITNDYLHYNGGVYIHPRVRVLIDEGRSVLHREDASYDLIFLSQIVTLAAERNGIALSENAVFTVEAFGDYLDHLNPDGHLAFKLYDELTLTRALSTALAAFQRRGLSEAEALRRVTVFVDPADSPQVPLLLIRNAPFAPDEALGYGAVAREVGLEPLLLPGVLAEPPLDDVFSGASSFAELVAGSEANLSAPSDDRPFFYQFERGVPSELAPLLLGMAVLLLLGGGAAAWAQRRVRLAAPRWMPVYFAALGVGFMGVEIALIQQMRLFLGHPTFAVTAVLAALLLGGGVGSELAGRGSRTTRAPVWPLAGVLIALAAWLLLWPLAEDAFRGAGTWGRLLVAVTSLLPLALFMGMPFALGLRAVGRFGERHVALAWAVNGVTTVAGSVFSFAVAVQYGFTAVLWLGIGLYGLALLWAWVGRVRGAFELDPSTALH